MARLLLFYPWKGGRVKTLLIFMRLRDLAEKSGTRVLYPGRLTDIRITHIFAGDRISDLLEQAREDTLIVTRLANAQLMRVCELMDVPAVCLVNGMEPEARLVQAAQALGTGLLVSPDGPEETMARMRNCLREEEGLR